MQPEQVCIASPDGYNEVTATLNMVQNSMALKIMFSYEFLQFSFLILKQSLSLRFKCGKVKLYSIVYIHCYGHADSYYNGTRLSWFIVLSMLLLTLCYNTF
jgi:hypothetical protein